jgi:TolB protein
VRRITNDLNSYADVSLTADSGTISATESELSSTLWTAPRGEAELSRGITSNEKDYDGLGGMAWTPDGRILFASYRGGNLDLWISDADGANSRQLTRGPGSNINPAVSADGRTFVFVSTRTGASCLWKMDSDGRNIVQLTRGGSETLPQISPDGKFVVYQSFATGAGGVWKVPLEGGEPAQIIQRAFHPVISPDGKLLAVTKNRTDPPSYYFEIIPVTGGPSIKQSDYPVTDIGVSPTWSPDGRGLVYLDSREGVGNLWLQPIASGKPKQLTNFTSERIFGFVWSRDGKQLALARGTTSSDIVLIRKFR